MILEIDIGNTRIKWRLRNDQKICCSYAAYSALLSCETNYEEIFTGLRMDDVIAHISIASVATTYHTKLATWLEQRFQCQPVFAEVAVRSGGVVNGYTQVSQMGVDRWLALLGARARTQSACLVVDAGSAVTVDVLLGNGVHQGGYIVPGLQMMNAALFSNTDRVKIESGGYPSLLDLGKGTQAAVLSGLPSMILGLIERSLRSMKGEGVIEPCVLVTGGDGEYIARLLVAEGYAQVVYVPDLVLDGLDVSVRADI